MNCDVARDHCILFLFKTIHRIGFTAPSVEEEQEGSSAVLWVWLLSSITAHKRSVDATGPLARCLISAAACGEALTAGPLQQKFCFTGVCVFSFTQEHPSHRHTIAPTLPGYYDSLISLVRQSVLISALAHFSRVHRVRNTQPVSQSSEFDAGFVEKPARCSFVLRSLTVSPSRAVTSAVRLQKRAATAAALTSRSAVARWRAVAVRRSAAQ